MGDRERANQNLNAVSYANPGFIAVGDGGEIVTSTDGLNGWSNENLGAANTNGLPAGFGVNLRGVTFATSGQLAGVGMIVGEGGTVILAGDTPPNPILTPASDILVCEDAPLPATNVLSVDIDLTNPHFPPNTLTVDWFDQFGQPTTNTFSSSTSSSVLFTTDSSVSDLNTIKTNLFYAQTRDLRTGFISQKVTVTLPVNSPRPRSVLASTNSGANFFAANCNNPTNYTITNIITGIGPWVVTWNDGFSTTVGAGPGPLPMLGPWFRSSFPGRLEQQRLLHRFNYQYRHLHDELATGRFHWHHDHHRQSPPDRDAHLDQRSRAGLVYRHRLQWRSRFFTDEYLPRHRAVDRHLERWLFRDRRQRPRGRSPTFITYFRLTHWKTPPATIFISSPRYRTLRVPPMAVSMARTSSRSIRGPKPSFCQQTFPL